MTSINNTYIQESHYIRSYQILFLSDAALSGSDLCSHGLSIEELSLPLAAALILQIGVFVSTKISEIIEALANNLTIQPISRTQNVDFLKIV